MNSWAAILAGLASALFAYCVGPEAGWGQVGEATHAGGDLEVRVEPDAHVRSSMPLTVYMLEASVPIGPRQAAGARSVTVYPEGQLIVRRETRPGIFGEVIYQSRIASAKPPFKLLIPASVLPQQPFRLWVGGPFKIEVLGIELVNGKSLEAPFRYPFALVTPISTAA